MVLPSFDAGFRAEMKDGSWMMVMERPVLSWTRSLNGHCCLDMGCLIDPYRTGLESRFLITTLVEKILHHDAGQRYVRLYTDAGPRL